MALIQTIVDCVEICHQKGIRNVFLCPGSRNAALIVAFEQHPQITCYSISDERSAAFMAMGMAAATGKTVAIVCTSGTAALNFAPGVAEAFFQEVPLLVITADRPPEWIHQYDGQTIFQENIFGRHVKKSYNLLPDFEKADVDWFAQRVFNEAIDLSNVDAHGPVHINIPVREPFYPASNDTIAPSGQLRVIALAKPDRSIALSADMVDAFKLAKNILVLVGQQHQESLDIQLQQLATDPRVTVIGDCISNVSSDVTTQDVLFKHLPDGKTPQLLITCGKSLISKNLKLYFRKNNVAQHWHIQATDVIYDPLQSLTHRLVCEPTPFFNELNKHRHAADDVNPQDLLKNELTTLNTKYTGQLQHKVGQLVFSDVAFVAKFLAEIQGNAVLHLGNSLSVRYVNVLQCLMPGPVQVFCNRGTSGIEGSLSTAVGHAMTTDKTVYCLLGDVSFQYDKNALWNNYLPKNLKIIVLNNGGGNIFRMIPGPTSQHSYKPFFETEQRNAADRLAEEFRLTYLSITSEDTYHCIDGLNTSEGAVILEVFTEPTANERAYKSLFAPS